MNRRLTIRTWIPSVLLILASFGLGGCPVAPVVTEPAPPRREPPPRDPSLAAQAPTALVRTGVLVADPKRFSFLVFGDSRANGSYCIDKHATRLRCAGPEHTTDGSCPLLGRAPAIVMGEAARALRAKESAFALFTGDLVYRGSCAADWAWAKQTFLSKVPPNRVYLAMGNHDLWQKSGEPAPSGFFARAFPYLKPLLEARRDRRHHHAFRVGRSLIVSLCSGGYPRKGGHEAFRRADQTWSCQHADLAKQLAWLEALVVREHARGLDHVVVGWHKPSFSCSAHRGLDTSQDPLPALAKLKQRHRTLTFFTVAAHNHTTELYVHQGIPHLVAGGGGARQYLRSRCRKERTQPPERFWKGAKKRRRYNLFQVKIQGRNLSLTERCLARKAGRLVWQNGATITADGRVSGRAGSCQLGPRVRGPRPRAVH